MSRIVLTTWGSLGDLHPMIALSLELRDRGHDIILATTQNYRETVESLALNFHTVWKSTRTNRCEIRINR